MESDYIPLHIISFPLQDLVAVASSNRIIFYNIQDASKKMLVLPSITFKSDLNETVNDYSRNDDSDTSKSSDEAAIEQVDNMGLFSSAVFIKGLHCLFSEEISLFAVADSFKRIFVYEYPSMRLCFNTQMPKAITKILISPDYKKILIGDKFGDLYSIAISQKVAAVLDPHLSATKNPYLIMGHISILTDMILDNSQKFIYTSQRDQKIKCSFYSHPEVINNYILGHYEYISSICLIEAENIILSVGGDPYILVSDISTEKIKCSRISFESFIPEPLLSDLQKLGIGNFNCLKIILIGPGMFSLLFENCNRIPVFKLDYSNLTSSLVHVLEFESCVVDIVSSYGTISCTSEPKMAFILVGKKSILISELLESKNEFDQIHSFDIPDNLLEEELIRQCSLSISRMKTYHTLRRGYNFSEKIKERAVKKRTV